MERRKSKTDPTRGLYQRGNVWWIKIWLEKQGYPISLQTDDQTKAIAEAIKVRENPERYIIRPGKWDREVEEYLQAKLDGTAPGKRHRGDTTTHTRDSLKKFYDMRGFSPLLPRAVIISTAGLKKCARMAWLIHPSRRTMRE